MDPVRGWLPGPGPGRAGDPGLYPLGSVARRVNAETVLLLTGGRALLLQLAHPMVAAGVADHSDFLHDPFGRLARTLDLTLTVSFGDADQRHAAAARVAEAHRLVTGEHDGRSYRALDPELLLWVHATLVDSALVGYQRFVGRITEEARERYHAEMRWQAAAFGVPDDRLPPSLEDFRAYVNETVATLVVTDEARTLAQGVLRPRVPAPLHPAARTMAFMTTALLPDRIRTAYGLSWSARNERIFAAAAATIRATRPLLPDPLRRWPHARDADARMFRRAEASFGNPTGR